MTITYDENLRAKLLCGIDKLANAVKVTLGPKGRNVAMYQKQNIRGAEYSDKAVSGAHVLITNDGVTVAKSIVLPDPVENMGAELMKEVAGKTKNEGGDGTTTATVLAQSLLHEVFRNIAAGANPIMLKRGIEKAGKVAIHELKAIAKPSQTKEMLSYVASISCGDRHLGDMIGEVVFKLGPEGFITVEDSQKVETTIDVLQGIVFERGFIAPFMATDRMESVAELYDPYILLYDGKFSDSQDILPFLIACAEDGHDALIISDGVEGEALGLIAKNKLQGDMNVVCVMAPLYGEGRRWRMEDLAVQTGGTYVTKELCMNVRNVTRDMFGRAKRVTVTKRRTAITEPGGDPEKMQFKINEIRKLIENCDYDFNKERYKERLATFVSGVARIKVGGRTETELWERKMLIENAVNATRAALEEGVVPGGGTALLRVIPAIETVATSLPGDEKIGANAVITALKAPIKQIAVNAGLDGDLIVEKVLHAPPHIGYDVEKDRFTDMLTEGIIDPVKVTRLALESALSVSATLLTTQAAITGKKRWREEQHDGQRGKVQKVY